MRITKKTVAGANANYAALQKEIRKVNLMNNDLVHQLATTIKERDEHWKERDAAEAKANACVGMMSQTLQEKAEMMGQVMEMPRLKKQLDIIQKIITGKQTEAIQALLDPTVYAFNVQVVFADKEKKENENG